jgi:hypothetical protein
MFVVFTSTGVLNPSKHPQVLKSTYRKLLSMLMNEHIFSLSFGMGTWI